MLAITLTTASLNALFTMAAENLLATNSKKYAVLLVGLKIPNQLQTIHNQMQLMKECTKQ